MQQKEVEFLHNENQLLEGHLQRVRLSCGFSRSYLSTMVKTWCCPGCSVSAGVSCRGGATGIVKELQVTSLPGIIQLGD